MCLDGDMTTSYAYRTHTARTARTPLWLTLVLLAALVLILEALWHTAAPDDRGIPEQTPTTIEQIRA